MNVPVKVEFRYDNSGPRNVPAGSTEEFSFPAPAGWVGISWGFAGVHPILEFQTCTFVPDDVVGQRFTATVRNPSGTDRTVRFTFMLMKLD